MNTPNCFNIKAATLCSLRIDADCHGQQAAEFSDISYRYYIYAENMSTVDSRRENLRQEHGYFFWYC
jgi:hypothetical protein